MRQQYYLRQRANGGIYHVIFVDPISNKQIDRTTGTNDEKKLMRGRFFGHKEIYHINQGSERLN